MAINFPDSPAADDEFTSGSTTWVYNSGKWTLKPVASTSLDPSDDQIVLAGRVFG